MEIFTILNNWQWLIFLLLIVSLFFVSHSTTNELFYFLRIFFKSEKTVFGLVSLIYLPGTIMHEMAHFLTATILIIKVREVKILPEFEENYIKLGKVLYEKKDFVRGVLIGIAPLIIGLGFLWWLALIQIFPNSIWYINLLLGYVIFSVSSTMFSSAQDLVDLVYIFPVFFFAGVIIYIFNIRIDLLFNNSNLIDEINQVFAIINSYLFLSLTLNLATMIVARGFRKLFHKR